jgi:nucleoside-diphosphate-sugar epimerase
MVLLKQLNGMSQISNILVTGGAGFIGSHFVKRLINKGYNVTVIDNLERGKLEFLPDNINFHKLDLRDYDSIKDIFKDQDCVVHLASKVGGIGTYLSKPYDVMSSNITIDSNVLKAIIENNISKYFYASSAHIYPKSLQTTKDSPLINESQAYPADPELSYGWAKLIGELSVQSATKEYSFLKAAIARFIGIYGPDQDFELETGSVIPVFSHRAIKYPEVDFNVWGTGEETRSYCYIDDTLDCMELMIQKLDELDLVGPLNVGKEERISISEIANIVTTISGKDIKVDYDTTKNTVIWGQWCECKEAKKVLGWEAKTTLEEGIKNVYNNIEDRINGFK